MIHIPEEAEDQEYKNASNFLHHINLKSSDCAIETPLLTEMGQEALKASAFVPQESPSPGKAL